MTEVISAVLGALVGLVGAYVLDIRKSRAESREVRLEAASERRRNRQAVATAILYDLKRLEFDLHQLFESKTPTRAAVTFPDLFFTDLRAETRWFAPSSIQPIAEFFRQAAFAFNTLQLIRDTGLRSNNPDHQEHHIRCLCAFALQQLPAAASALKNEGGIPAEADLHPTVAYPELPEVPKRLFPDVAVGPTPATGETKDSA